MIALCNNRIFIISITVVLLSIISSFALSQEQKRDSLTQKPVIPLKSYHIKDGYHWERKGVDYYNQYYISPTSILQCMLISVQPDKGQYSHSHPHDQVYLVLKGKGTFYVGDFAFEMQAGEVVNIPYNVEHSSKNTGSESLEYLNIRASDAVYHSNLPGMYWYSKWKDCPFIINDGITYYSLIPGGVSSTISAQLISVPKGKKTVSTLWKIGSNQDYHYIIIKGQAAIREYTHGDTPSPHIVVGPYEVVKIPCNAAFELETITSEPCEYIQVGPIQ